MMKVGAFPQGQEFRSRAQSLAQEYGLTLLDSGNNELPWKKLVKKFAAEEDRFDFILLVGSKGLELLSIQDAQPMAPIHVDFANSQWKRRLYNISAKKELAAKSLGLGLNKHKAKMVLDANAGLGQDLFIFAALGANVIAYERSGLVYCLLKDALDRAQQDMDLAGIVERISLRKGDSISALVQDDLSAVDAIYLDPMFPEKKHKSQARKEMSIFQKLLGDDSDAEILFGNSVEFMDRQNSCSRVVLKRPRLAPVLLAERLGRQETGNSTRFDLYF